MRELLERAFSRIAAGTILREPIACAADELPLDGAGELRAEYVGNAFHLYCIDFGRGSVPLWAAFVVTLAVSFLRGPAIEPIVVRRIDSWPGLAAVLGRHMLAIGRGLAASIGPIARIVVAPTLFLNPIMRSGLLICPRTVASLLQV